MEGAGRSRLYRCQNIISVKQEFIDYSLLPVDAKAKRPTGLRPLCAVVYRLGTPIGAFCRTKICSKKSGDIPGFKIKLCS